MEENNQYAETICYKSKNAYETLDSQACINAENFCEEYKQFLNCSKTERETVTSARSVLEEAGFVPYSFGMKLKPGDRIYGVNSNRALIAAVVGEQPGANIVAAHIDSPRIDLKPCPLYEDSEMSFFKTHYYGGIKKYQWVTIPLELHGVVINGEGESIDVNLGSEEDDPVFCITDLLPHLAQEQVTKTASALFSGENLNVLAGASPYADVKEDKYKLSAMSILNGMYDFTERDFATAELCFVPAGRARDVGLDRSFVGSYGQDDRVCAYPSLRALADLEGVPVKTAVCILADKEEIGSDGITGMQSAWFDAFINRIADVYDCRLSEFYIQSKCMSADVGAAYDPLYADAYDKRNTAFANHGVLIMRYTGSRGKSGSSDAPAELMADLCGSFDRAGVVWQIGELGRVDLGGGGTVAKYMANRGIQTVDVGVPLLCMHSPFELAAKLDVYMMNCAAAAFYNHL